MPRVPEDYLLAGHSFEQYLDHVSTEFLHAADARRDLKQQVDRFLVARQKNIRSVRMSKALRHAGVELSFWDQTVGEVLARCRTIKGAPEWPGDQAWKSPNVTNLHQLSSVLAYARRSAQLLDGKLSKLADLASESSQLSIEARSVVSSALPFVPGWRRALQELVWHCDTAALQRAVTTYDGYASLKLDMTGTPVLHLSDVPPAVLGSLARSIPELALASGGP